MNKKGKSLFVGCLVVLISGCSTSPGTREIVDTFKLYDSSEDKVAFCKSHPELGMNAQECVNNLVIYTRSQDACKKSTRDDPYCITRNLNGWSYLNLNMKSALNNVGAKSDPDAYYRLMHKRALEFQLTCLRGTENVVPCDSLPD